jgi:predicted DCC family thiol-disulfide oxidoreductase YuxK
MIENTILYVLYDGTCGLCHWSIDLFNKTKKLPSDTSVKYTPQMSKDGYSLIKKFNVMDSIDSIYVIHEGKVYYKSQAVLHLLKFTKFPYRYLSIFKYLPNIVLDFLYDCMAKVRKKIFKNPKEVCDI